MRIAGVDISGSEAVFVVLEHDQGLIEIIPSRNPKISLRQSEVQGDMRYVQRAIAQFLSDYKVDEVIIRERPTRGKFSGSATSFKIEAAFQLLLDFSVKLIANRELKDTLKRFPLAIDYAASGLKKYQRTAFDCAYARINGAKTADEQPPEE